MESVQFTEGMYFNLPSEKAPDFIKGSLSIEPKQFTDWLRKNYDKDEKYIRIDLKVARSGKAYASLSTYKPNQTQGNGNGGYHGNPQQSGGNPGQGVTPENFKDDNFGEEIPF